MNKFLNANKAFHHLYARILKFGVDFDDTKALFNVGFEIENPMNNFIANSHYLKRNWKQEYAEAEWQWYLSGDRNIKRLGEIYGKVPEIWRHMADGKGNVNSNYGWQWKRDGQLADRLEIRLGTYYHFAHNLHLYNNIIEKL